MLEALDGGSAARRAKRAGGRGFLLGRLMATPGALNAFAATGENPIDYIVHQLNLDPGVLAAEDQLANLVPSKKSSDTTNLHSAD